MTGEYRSGCNCIAPGEMAEACGQLRQLVSGRCACSCHDGIAFDKDAFKRVMDAFELTPCQRGFHFNPKGDNWCVRCGAELDADGRATGRSVKVGTIQVKTSVTELKRADVPGAPLTWAVERDCVIVTCPNGHEMGVIGHTYTRHTIDAEGNVSPSVLCPAADCDFSQLCKLLDY